MSGEMPELKTVAQFFTSSWPSACMMMKATSEKRVEGQNARQKSIKNTIPEKLHARKSRAPKITTTAIAVFTV
jgi:hypothetical protein